MSDLIYIIALLIFERRQKKMMIAVAIPRYARINPFEEDVYRELQKWERCASP
jgi:hypothetical protein